MKYHVRKFVELVKQHAGEAIVNNPAIPNEQNDAVIQETTNPSQVDFRICWRLEE